MVPLLQTHTVVSALGDYMGVESHAFVGGRSMREDIVRARNGVHVGIGTPGRIKQMLEKRFIGMKYTVMIR